MLDFSLIPPLGENGVWRASSHAVFELIKCNKVPVHTITGYIYLYSSDRQPFFSVRGSHSVYLFAFEYVREMICGSMSLDTNATSSDDWIHPSVLLRKQKRIASTSLSNTEYLYTHTKTNVWANMSLVFTWEKLSGSKRGNSERERDCLWWSAKQRDRSEQTVLLLSLSRCFASQSAVGILHCQVDPGILLLVVWSLVYSPWDISRTEVGKWHLLLLWCWAACYYSIASTAIRN